MQISSIVRFLFSLLIAAAAFLAGNHCPRLFRQPTPAVASRLAAVVQAQPRSVPPPDRSEQGSSMLEHLSAQIRHFESRCDEVRQQFNEVHIRYRILRNGGAEEAAAPCLRLLRECQSLEASIARMTDQIERLRCAETELRRALADASPSPVDADTLLTRQADAIRRRLAPPSARPVIPDAVWIDGDRYMKLAPTPSKTNPGL